MMLLNHDNFIKVGLSLNKLVKSKALKRRTGHGSYSLLKGSQTSPSQHLGKWKSNLRKT